MRILSSVLVLALLFPQLAFAKTISASDQQRISAERISRRTLRKTVIQENTARAAERPPQLVALQKIFRNIDAGISIRHAADWAVQHLAEREGVLTLLVLFLSPPSEESGISQNINLILEDVSPDMTLQEYTNAAIHNEQAILPGFQLLSTDRVTIAGHAGQRVRFIASGGIGMMGFEQVWLLRDSVAHVWTFADDARTFNANLATFDAMLDTLIVR